MSQDDEPSLVDYARFYGLIRDHLQEPILQGFAAPHDFLSQLDDTADLFQIRDDCVNVPEERLSIDADTASLLSEIAALAKDAPSRFETYDEYNVRRIQRMKNDLPVLRTDHEVDLLRFAPTIEPHLEHEHLPLETIDQEADEGFEWPSTCHELPEKYDRKLKAERLVFPKEALIYLQQTLTSPAESDGVFEDVELPYTRTKVQPVSPPLLHLSPVIQPFVPSSDTGKLEFLSDATSPTAEEVRQVEREIFRNDAILPVKKEADPSSQDSNQLLLDSDIGEIFSPLKGIAEPPTSPQTPRRRLQDRKVEVPLSPPRSEQLPPWKREGVSWRESLTEIVHDMPLPIPEPENVSSEDIDAFFDENIRPIGIKVERSIEQEQLQEADTTLRVTVPIMDFSLPIAPWKPSVQDRKASDEDLYKQALIEMKSLHFSKHVWPLSGKLERELKWTAIPAALGKVETQESISNDGFVEKYLEAPDRVDVATLTWKPDGLRILDELAESDEELDEGIFPEERDIQSLLKKRKFELDVVEDDLAQGDVNIKAARTEFHQETQQAQNKNMGNLFANFSALDALDNYMGARKGQLEKPKLSAEKYFPPAKAAPSTHLPRHDAQANASLSTPGRRPMPLPVFNVPTTTIPFVVSATFLSKRKLSRHIQRIFPTADFIERDFNLYLDPQQRPASVPSAGPTAQSTMADEADMILSPSTGLIWTTLQKIKQCSLPGQVARSPVRERISGAAPRYERLLVMVSADRQAGDSLGVSEDDNAQLDTRDCEALVEFTSFCAMLESETHVTFVAGGEEDLAEWIVAMMVKYGVADSNLKLIQDETLWEVFLRRAGMNAFAAQAILGSLKAVDQDGREGVAASGLPQFITMSVEERFARFETLLGGRKLLGRVSRVLDARW